MASLALNMYVTPEHTYDFEKLAEVTKVIVRNLNKIIDINYYPIPEVWPDFSANWSLLNPRWRTFVLVWLPSEWWERRKMKRPCVSVECGLLRSEMFTFLLFLNLLAQRHTYQINAIGPLELGCKV